MRDILIYGVISSQPGEGLVSAREVVDALDRLARTPGDIHVRIHSPGGDVQAGIAIYNAIRKVSPRVVVTVEGTAYSMASVIAMAGREVRMYELAQIMVHDPTGEARGGVRDFEAALGALRAAKQVLVDAYSSKTGRPKEEIEAMMEKTTFMNGKQAREMGFVDVVLGDQARPMAAFDAAAWTAYHRGEGPMPVKIAANAGGVAATIAELREACPQASDTFILKALEAGQSVSQAQAQHNSELAAENAALRAERDRLKAAATPPKAQGGIGVKALGMGNGTGNVADGSGDAVTAFHDAISAHVAKGRTRAQAVSAIYRQDRGTYDAFMEANGAG